MSFSRLLKATTLAAGCFFMVGAASASTILTTAVVYTIDPEQTDWTHPFVVAKYDPLETGYALNSVHLTLEGTASTGPGSVVCVTPGGGGTCEGTASSKITMTLTGPAPGSFLLSQIIPLTTFTYSLAGGGFATIPLDSDTKLQTKDYVLPSGQFGDDPNEAAIIAMFSANGGGLINLSLFADGDFNAGTSTGFAVAGNPILGSAKLTVTYDYLVPDGVPEPTTMVLLGSSLLVAGFFARRRRNVNS